MMRSFFNDVPVEIDEAAMVDGCTRPRAFFLTILPLAKSGLAATMVFCLIMAWNEYFFALILTSVKTKTLPAALTSFQTLQGLLLGQMCAAGTVVMMPILIFALFMQKHLVRGLTMGAVKG
jgi:ABC-type glycerol-3-phosphate transport system permease component